MITGICESCEWYSKLNPILGECHKYAPQPAIVEIKTGDKVKFRTEWPEVAFDAWCGEYVEESLARL